MVAGGGLRLARRGSGVHGFRSGLPDDPCFVGFLGASLGAPFCFFVSGFPLFHWLGPIALGANFLAAGLLHRGRPDIAFAALIPFVMVTVTLAVFAFRDITLLRG